MSSIIPLYQFFKIGEPPINIFSKLSPIIVESTTEKIVSPSI